MKPVLVLAAAYLLLFSCKKDEPAPPSEGRLSIEMSYVFDGVQFDADTMLYTIQAGYPVSVEHLEYYISNVTLHKADNSSVQTWDIFYLNLKENDFDKIRLEKIPAGDYVGISFLVGLDAEHNKTNALPSTWYNNNMAWPDGMGGGYHFMKLEGRYKDQASTRGYAVHLGRNENLVTTAFIPGKISVSATGGNTELVMDIAEWFKSPNEYDFKVDGDYTMSNGAVMKKISENGRDAFHLKD